MLRRFLTRVLAALAADDSNPVEPLPPRRLRRLVARGRAKGRDTARRFWTAKERHPTPQQPDARDLALSGDSRMKRGLAGNKAPIVIALAVLIVAAGLLFVALVDLCPEGFVRECATGWLVKLIGFTCECVPA